MPDDPSDQPNPGPPPEGMPEAEPEGGPIERQRAFLAERLTPLRPVGDAEPDAPGPDAAEPDAAEPAAEGRRGAQVEAPSGPAEELFADTAGRLPPDFRQRRMEEYRQAQTANDPTLAEDAPEGAHEGDDPPPPPVRGGAVAGGWPEAEARPQAPPEPPAPPPAENWVPIGPSVVRRGQAATQPGTSGRATAIAVAPGGDRVYVGAANGGVWRSDNAGRSWHSLMDAFDLNPTTTGADSLAIGAIALDPTNPDRLFVGTGEGAGGAYFGVGPVVTTDGGVSWATEATAPGSPPVAGSAFYALAVDPGDPNRVVAATYVGLYRREPNGSGGFHWARKQSGSWSSVVAARTGGTTTFYAARTTGPVQSSTDGHSWATAGSGFPAADVGMVGLAVQPTNPSVVYALAAKASNYHLLGVYRLATADGTWRQVSGAPATLFGPDLTSQGQGWYDLAVAVDPVDVNRTYLGGSIVSSGGEWSGSVYRGAVTLSGSTPSMTATYIGNSVHGDIHALAFAPGDSSKLWLGCDGGIFYSTNPTGSGDIFGARNTGLATLTMNYLDQHPSEDAILLCGTQDNGAVRFTGEEAWLYSSGGDGGFAVINWADPYRMLTTYVYGAVQRSTDGGQRYSYSDVPVPLASGEQVLFYAPIAGTPPNPAVPADADVVAFGSIRPWVTTTFGTGWASIPSGTLAGDSLNATVRSLAFASASRLYAGTVAGGVYRFDKAGATWTRTQINTVGGASALPLAGVVTDIAVDRADATGGSIYICFGGMGDYRHVWHFDGATWSARSGPAAGGATSLLDVQVTALEVDPAHTTHVYAGADIGIWRSTDSGATWAPFSQGLPDAAVLDLRLHPARRLLRAATHGRGVWERRIDSTTAVGVELFVRDTQLDQGRFPTVDGLPDPTAPGAAVVHWRGPDIRLDTPDSGGNYQFPLTGDIDFYEFVDKLTDDFQNVATHASATIVTRVYVQVHNRGVLPADGVRVMLLLANASVTLPPLPAGYTANVQSGTPITTPDWRTVGITTLDGVRAGFPKIAAFNLPSSMLPPPASLAGNDHHCVLALIHHATDAFTNTTTTVTDTLSRSERKAAHKNLRVVQFTGTLPPAMPLVVPVGVNNASADQLEASLVLALNGYPGRVRLLVPAPLAEQLGTLVGLERSKDWDGVRTWAEAQLAVIRAAETTKAYDPEWTTRQGHDIEAGLQGALLMAVKHDEVSIRRLRLEAGAGHTVFVFVDRPKRSNVGDAFELRAALLDARRGELIGGLDFRVEVAPVPPPSRYQLDLRSEPWKRNWFLVAARVTLDGRAQTPDDGVEVVLLADAGGQTTELGRMRHVARRRAFVSYVERTRATLIARVLRNGVVVCEGKLEVGSR